MPSKHQWIGASDLARICLRYIEDFSEPPPAFAWQEPVRDEYESAFARIQNLIQQGQIDKAVPVVFARAQAKVTAVVKARWILELLQAPLSLHVHGIWNQDEGLLGVTPEILFDFRGRELTTMALAGTLAKEDGSANDLLRSSKDQQEHRYVVEDLRNELSRLGHVRVGPTEIKELPSLWHLHTKITAQLRDEPDVADLINRLHPTAALGVFPRQFGWRWMAELPGQQGRGSFGAPFTVRMGSDRVRSLVAIRNLQWQGENILLGSGGGVVKDSRIEPEWIELQRKRQSVLRLFGMAK
ncbi:MAG: chorismate-binding protein [Bdellovibrionaceae bacterium]|nr:chorismate-binding protein [Pseudobdellovibrionaceae bacterium]